MPNDGSNPLPEVEVFRTKSCPMYDNSSMVYQIAFPIRHEVGAFMAEGGRQFRLQTGLQDRQRIGR